MQPKLISTEYINQHQYFNARRDAYQLASGKIVDPYFVVELPPSATAMAITVDNQVILISQYRHPISKEILELPGGFIEAGEDIFEGIKRELLEETGYTFKDVHHLGNTAANPGVLNNFTALFLATGGIKTSNQSLDNNEEISIQLKSLKEVKELLKQSKFMQSMHALCLFYGFEKLEEM